jgi:23S rRNA (cytosine1962-C5)-methyltransferase
MKISATVILKKGREDSIKRFHPWIFSGAIHKIEGEAEDGNWAKVLDSGGKILGYGHYQKGTITVRILSFNEPVPDSTFWHKKIEKAFQQRLITGVLSDHTNAFRLIHGEGDGLPGLIVDIYNGVAVLQAHSTGMHLDRDEIAQAIKTVLGDAITMIYYKSQSTLQGLKQNEYLAGTKEIAENDEAQGKAGHVILEHGHPFLVDWETGQKTGFFLDQRENRKLLGEFSKGKTLLNTFCYTGGFSVYALKAGAKLVHSVDASEKAVDMTKKNIELNGFSSEEHASFVADTFEYLKGKKDFYDLIVLDPPAFAKHKDARHQAMKGYQRLNAEAMTVIRPGGIIFTFSCSQVVDRQLFYDTVVSAAIQTGRTIKVLDQLSQPADHPVSVYHSEGDYLKGLVLYVE